MKQFLIAMLIVAGLGIALVVGIAGFTFISIALELSATAAPTPVVQPSKATAPPVEENMFAQYRQPAKAGPKLTPVEGNPFEKYRPPAPVVISQSEIDRLNAESRAYNAQLDQAEATAAAVWRAAPVKPIATYTPPPASQATYRYQPPPQYRAPAPSYNLEEPVVTTTYSNGPDPYQPTRYADARGRELPNARAAGPNGYYDQNNNFRSTFDRGDGVQQTFRNSRTPIAAYNEVGEALNQ